MKSLFFSAFICLLAGTLSAQQPMIRTHAPVRISSSDQQPLIIVDSVATDFNHLIIAPDRIVSIDVLKDSASVRRYGDQARFGVVIIHTKEKGAVIPLDKLLDEFHIASADRALPVCINHVLVNDNKRLLADRSNIIKIEVITDTYWISPMQAGPEERHINIVTSKAAKPAF